MVEKKRDTLVAMSVPVDTRVEELLWDKRQHKKSQQVRRRKPNADDGHLRGPRKLTVKIICLGAYLKAIFASQFLFSVLGVYKCP